MILLGDKLVEYENIFKIDSQEDILNTQANSTVVFKYDEKLLKYTSEQNIASAVIVSNIKECIYANALDTKYIISSFELAIKLQKIADNYMFDSKILAIIESNDEFEQIACAEIDGVIYKEIL